MERDMASFVRNILTSLTYEQAMPPPGGDQIVALGKLDQRLAGFAQNGAGARTAIMIQPGDCDVWNGNPRDQPGLTPESCRSLIDSIASEDGNRIPVLVRLNGAEAERPYELLVGSRRRFAVDWLNHNGRPELRLSALIVDLSDEEAFRLADIENRERADITELDRARRLSECGRPLLWRRPSRAWPTRSISPTASSAGCFRWRSFPRKSSQPSPPRTSCACAIPKCSRRCCAASTRMRLSSRKH